MGSEEDDEGRGDSGRGCGWAVRRFETSQPLTLPWRAAESCYVLVLLRIGDSQLPTILIIAH